MLIAITIVQLLAALVLILVVLFQSGKSQGLSGTIGGIADSYMSKGKARTIDAKLAKATKWVGAVFVVLTLVLDCMVAAGMCFAVDPLKTRSYASGFFARSTGGTRSAAGSGCTRLYYKKALCYDAES